MRTKSGAKKKSGGTCNGYVKDSDLVAELKERIAVLENLLSKREDAISPDIIERKRAEEELARLASIVTSSDDAIIGKTLDGVITSWNEGAEKLYGYLEVEVVGKPIGIIVPPDRMRELQGIMARIQHGERVERLETERVIKDGRRIDVSITISPIIYASGNVIGASTIARDITERKRAEEAVRKSEKFLSNVLDCIQDGISILDKDLTIVRTNHVQEEWYPYMMPLVGKKCYYAYHTRDAPCPICPSIKAIKEKTMQSAIVPLSGETGQRGWLEVYSYPMTDEKGNVVGVVEHVRDITGRKRAEEALRESEARYRELVENANSIIIRWDAQGNLTFFNEYAEKLFGYSKNEILGRNVVGTIVPLSESTGRDLAALMEDVERYPERYKLNVNENMRKNGDRVWIAWTNKAIHDEHGNVVEILSVGNDITERKRAEEDLRLTQFSIDRASDMALWVAPDGRFIYANEAACKAFGYTREEFVSLKAFDTNPYFNEKNWGEHWKEVKERGSFTFEARLRKKDGNFFPGEITVNYLIYEGKEYNCSYIRDITERKRAEESLKEAKQRAELYLDLMGHDINNMHQVALGYLELARDMLPGEEQAKFLDKPVEVLQRSTQLITNVRKLQKLKEGVFQTQEVDVCEVLRSVQREFGAVPHKAITLNTNRCEQCLVGANELLHDVFANLVSNAIKHTGDRTDIIIDIDVLKDKSNKYCRVMIEDDGPGIPDDFKCVIFNRALRGTSKAKGMGLGLYLVKSLVDSYGGQVWVEDRVPGNHTKGARFVVLLPTIDH